MKTLRSALFAAIPMVALGISRPASAADYDFSDDAIQDGRKSWGRTVSFNGVHFGAGLTDPDSFNVMAFGQTPAIWNVMTLKAEQKALVKTFQKGWVLHVNCTIFPAGKPLLIKGKEYQMPICSLNDVIVTATGGDQQGPIKSRDITAGGAPHTRQVDPQGAIAPTFDALGEALEKYRSDTGSYPTTSQGLNALLVAPAGAKKWRGPYTDHAHLKDPWQTPLRYDASQTPYFKMKIPHYQIISAGPDKKFGSKDDQETSYHVPLGE